MRNDNFKIIRSDRKEHIDSEIDTIRRLVLYLNDTERRYLIEKLHELEKSIFIRK